MTKNLPSPSRAVAYVIVSAILAWISMVLLPRIVGPVEATIIFGIPVVTFVITLSALLVIDIHRTKM